ncbi:MAG: adenylate cyclase [Acidimicrobiaceae bacterium]
MSDQQGPTLRELVSSLGIPEEEVARAAADGTLGLLAVSRFILSEEGIYTQAEIEQLSGLGPSARAYWRALGFTDPRPDERIFTRHDLEVLEMLRDMLSLGLVDEDVALQMARVIGASMSRIAAAQIDAIEARVDDAARDPDAPPALDVKPAVLRATALQDTMPRILEYAWRRHLQVAARRRMVRQAGAEGAGRVLAVGFADLVGFTALSQQLDDHELAQVVERFEATAYDTIGSRGGRVIKMIGDEVMFAVEDVKAGVYIALSLAEAYHDDEALSDVRVGLAAGPVLEREGDLFGPTVNLASRIVSIAYAGSVVVSSDVHDALVDDAGLRWKSLRTRYLKNIGRVQLWTVRRVGDEFEREGPFERARRRRGTIRDKVTEVIDRRRTAGDGAEGEEEE